MVRQKKKKKKTIKGFGSAAKNDHWCNFPSDLLQKSLNVIFHRLKINVIEILDQEQRSRAIFYFKHQ